MNILRGDLYYADLTPVTGSEQGGIRPVLMIQNDMGNRSKPLRPERTFRCTVRADPDH